MKTRENLKITLDTSINGHLLIWGRSGQGKSYFLCRKIEEYVEDGKKILIIDYSGSFTEKELAEKKFKYEEKIKRFRFKNPFEWNLRINDEEDFKKDVTDAFLEVFKCRSYFQQSLLEEAIEKVLDIQETVSIPDILKELKTMLQKERAAEEAAGNLDNLGRLLMRLSPYGSIENFYIKQGVSDRQGLPSVVIVDISDFPRKQRKFLAELFIKLLWRESFRQEFENRCDVLILDELQFLSLDEESALSNFLREGRKKGFEVVLSTQFIHNYGKAELEMLEQAANFLVFHPTPEDSYFSAKIIDKIDIKRQEKMLDSLGKGEAILKGQYCIKGRKKILTTPVVVKI